MTDECKERFSLSSPYDENMELLKNILKWFLTSIWIVGVLAAWWFLGTLLINRGYVRLGWIGRIGVLVSCIGYLASMVFGIREHYKREK